MQLLGEQVRQYHKHYKVIRTETRNIYWDNIHL